MNYIQATLRKLDANKFEVWVKFSGTSPFTDGNNTYIDKAGIPITFTSNEDIQSLHVDMDDEVFGAQNVYDVAINNLVSTAGVANSPQKYFSVNFEANADVNQVIKKGVEYKFFTFSFDKVPDDVALMNVSYRIMRGNEQAQFTIEDNHAVEYVQPFHNEGDPCVFYSTKGQSKISYAGAGSGGEAGFIPNTYVRYVKTITV